MRPNVVCLALSVTALAPTQAKPNAFQARYIAGHAGMRNRKSGVLYIEASVLVFTTDKGDSLFAIPLGQIKSAGDQADIRGATIGDKFLLGGLATDHKDDFVRVEWESDRDAEVVIWKVEPNTAAGISAKIRFAVKKLTGSDPGAKSGPTRQGPP